MYLKEVDPERHRRLAENAQKLGNFVHNLTMFLEDGLSDDQILPIYEILPNMQNIRSLKIIHNREDVTLHSALHRVVGELSHLEHLTIEENGFDPGFSRLPHPYVQVTQTFFHQFLHAILSTHGSRLKSLHLYTLLPLHRDLYITLRDDTPKLRQVSFAGNIDDALENEFEEPIPWSSGKTGSLECLVLLNCTLHSSYFARNVLCGVYGARLKEVKVIACGSGKSGKFYIPLSSPPLRSGSIEHLQADHMTAWEIDVLSHIPTQELSLTRLRDKNFRRLPALLRDKVLHSDGTQSGFPGLDRLRLHPSIAHDRAWERFPDDCKVSYQELTEKCLPERGINLSLDAVVWPDACYVHPHI